MTISEITDLPAVYIDPEWADKIGLTYPDPPPAKECEFCGKILKPVGWRALTRAEILKWTGWQECDCFEAQKRKLDLKVEEEIKKTKEKEAARKAELKKRIETLFDMSQLGKRFRTRTFENWKITPNNKHAYESAKKYALEFEKMKEKGIGLMLTGTMGTGKTHLAAAITISLINKGTPVIMNTMINLLNKIKGAYGGELKETENELINLYSTVDLLIIDDLGKERTNEWTLEKLYTIINARYENLLPVVITTNFDIERLISRLSLKNNTETAEAIVSRLNEMCVGLEMNYEDWRLKT